MLCHSCDEILEENKTKCAYTPYLLKGNLETNVFILLHWHTHDLKSNTECTGEQQ